jgi:hypothetical protein
MKQEKELRNKRHTRSEKLLEILEKDIALPRRKLVFLWINPLRVWGRRLLIKILVKKGSLLFIVLFVSNSSIFRLWLVL